MWLPLFERKRRAGRGRGGGGRSRRALWALRGLGLLPHGGGSLGGLWAEEGQDQDPHSLEARRPSSKPLPPGLLPGPLRGSDEARGLFGNLRLDCFSSEGPVVCARHARIAVSMCLSSPGALAPCTGHFAQAEA